MRHLVEGPDGSGKTTLVGNLARSMSLPVFKDRVGKTFFEAGDYASVELVQVSYLDLLDQMTAAGIDYVSDRGWISANVYNRADPSRAPLPGDLGDVRERALRYVGIEVIYAVTCPFEETCRRIASRGESPDVDWLRRVVSAYEDVYAEILGVGVPIVFVDGTRGLP